MSSVWSMRFLVSLVWEISSLLHCVFWLSVSRLYWNIHDFWTVMTLFRKSSSFPIHSKRSINILTPFNFSTATECWAPSSHTYTHKHTNLSDVQISDWNVVNWFPVQVQYLIFLNTKQQTKNSKFPTFPLFIGFHKMWVDQILENHTYLFNHP